MSLLSRTTPPSPRGGPPAGGTRLGRAVRTTAVLAATALTLAACGGGSDDAGTGAGDPTGGDGDVTIRFAWWGSDTRHRVTQEALDLFEEKNPGITVEADFTSWAGYFDKLNTAVAGGDTPDVITLEERFIAEYADNGVIADLEEVGLDLDGIEDDYVDLGRIGGTLYALPSGVNVHAYVVDPQIVADAGLEVPDDTTWTWDEFAGFVTAVADGTEDGVYGVQNFGFLDPILQIWLRQHEESLFTEDGGLGFDVDTVADWYAYLLELQRAGAMPDASKAEEVQAAGVEQSLVATNTGALSAFWSNQLPALTTSSGRELGLLRVPGEQEHSQPGMYLKASMNYAVSAKSDPARQEAAAKLIDFLVNDPDAGRLILSDRGLPVNADVLAAIEDELEPADRIGAEFLTDLRDELRPSPTVPPAGAGELPDIMLRLASEVFFERITPHEAAERFTTELGNAIS